MTWRTQDGRDIEISEMSDSHLMNTIKMIDRQAKSGIVVGGGGPDIEDMWCEEIFGKDVYYHIPEYKYLKKEAKKRNLL